MRIANVRYALEALAKKGSTVLGAQSSSPARVQRNQLDQWLLVRRYTGRRGRLRSQDRGAFFVRAERRVIRRTFVKLGLGWLSHDKTDAYRTPNSTILSVCLNNHSTPNRAEKLEMSKSTLVARMQNLLMFVPNMVLLCGRLMVDPRVPTKERLLVGGAIVYALVPFDLIPDMLPFVGQIDDAYLIALSLLRLTTVTDPMIVREHWRGGGDVVELLGATAMIASKFLPKRIRRVLTSHVESTGAEKKLRLTPILVERPQVEQVSDEL